MYAMAHLSQMKREFIEFILFHYSFKSRISVWLLNLIKSDDAYLNAIHVVEHVVPNHDTLIIATSEASEAAITLNLNGETWVNNNEIFKIIAVDKPMLDVKIAFKTQTKRHQRLEQLLLSQFMHSTKITPYVKDIHQLTLSPNDKHILTSNLKQRIDLSLQMKERQLFFQLTQLLNILNQK